MAVFKCKMCGASLNISEGQKVCECEYCGSTQTVPGINSDKIQGMLERANQFRINYDFDKALGLYETILEEENADPDIYWSIFLCKYGVNYVEDLATNKRIPTINRFQFASVYSDIDYKSAIERASDEQKAIYEQEVARIAEIQKTFMEISEKERPFDVFICYKETDEMGRRAVDSVLANDIYHALDKKGIKTFFSRITLEDKLGVDYEPYIFSALNSAKVMVVLGTKPEFFQAVWVKNEWARFISMINNGAEKTLIPAYKGMDPYQLPEEFVHVQALDMSKLGFMQDLIRGIEKILGKNEEKAEKVTEDQNVKQNDLGSTTGIKRMAIDFLTLEAYEKAYDIYEQILDGNAEDVDAYLGEIFVEYQAKNLMELEDRLINKCEIIVNEPEPSLRVCKDQAPILANKYEITGFLSKETIMKKLEFNLSYCQKWDNLEAYLNELENLLETKNFRYYMRFADDSQKEDMINLLERVKISVKDAVENQKKIEEEIIESRTKSYEVFLDKCIPELDKMKMKAEEERDRIYDRCLNDIRFGLNEYTIQNAVNELYRMGKYRDAEKYIIKGENKLNTVSTSKVVLEEILDTMASGNRSMWK